MKATTLPKVLKLKNGVTVPSIGLGTAFMKSETADVVYSSIKDGVRLVDTAAVYHCEEAVGKGIKRAIDEGIVKREDLFVITKLSIHDNNDPEGGIKKSLKLLGLDYVDLYLSHWPKFYSFDKDGKKIEILPLHKLWEKFESFVEKGYTKYIGVSNYNVQSLLNLLSFCKIKPLVNEIEFHPYFNQKKLHEFCNSEDILIIGYNPLVKGDYVKLTGEEKDRNLLGDQVVVELAKKYNKTPGQIVLNWIISVGVVPIPMTSNPKRMVENLGSTDFVMEKEDQDKIDSLNKMLRFGRSEMYDWEIYDNKIDVFA